MLYDTASGMSATMTCYAYDDLVSWRTIFPEDIYENRFRIMSENWHKGVEIAREEQKNATKLHSLMQTYPTIGFEAANHYYYTKGMLKEKIVNCQYIIDKYTK